MRWRMNDRGGEGGEKRGGEREEGGGEGVGKA